jgi:hypothetical protein
MAIMKPIGSMCLTQKPGETDAFASTMRSTRHAKYEHIELAAIPRADTVMGKLRAFFLAECV